MKKIVAITLTSCFLLSACNSDSRPVLDETINFDLTNQAPAKISYEISVNGDVSNLAYLGTPVEINISLINECSSIEVGFMLFSDGIPLHTTIDGKEAVMHIFHIDDEKTESFTVSFIPYGESGKTVALQPVSILYPSFSLTSMRNAAKTVYRIYDVGKKEIVQLHSLENATASFSVDNIGNIYTQTYNTDEFQFVKLENLSGAF